MVDMNNNIQESYCSYEVSKLLKEKGFKSRYPNMVYSSNGSYYGFGGTNDKRKGDINKTHYWGKVEESKRIDIITHALAIEWIRVNFGIWIRINVGLISTFTYTIEDMQLKPMHWNNQFKTPQEATEAALLYTLKNLI